MNIKHYDIKIEEINPFANCKLGREKYANILTNVITSYPYGFVMAINNKWGTGKTTFVRMWEQSLKDDDFQTVYFNAWENDFEDNPLTALMGELKSLATNATEPQFKKTLKTAALLSKNLAPAIVKAIADRYVDTEGIKEAIIGITQGLTDVFENEVQEYEKKKKNISDFKQNLAEFIAATNEGKPLVFIIDELDRCRPNYAVSILEQIKHFFSIPNIVFVLSIDKQQLGCAIKGVYGSDNIDAEEYLRRFIDLEYSIPEPETDSFFNYLYGYFKFDEFFESQERIRYGELKYDKLEFLETCKILFENADVPLRQQEKIFAHTRLALRSFTSNNYVLPHLFLYLNFVKIKYNDFYKSLIKKRLNIREVQENFIKTIKIAVTEETVSQIMWIEVYLMNAYNNSRDRHHYEKLTEGDRATGKEKSLYSSIIKENSEEEVMNILMNINHGRGAGRLDLSHLINKIELLENLKT